MTSLYFPLDSSDNGRVYIIDGSASLSGTNSTATVNCLARALRSLATSGGGSAGLMGSIVSDVNGDGNDDLIVGAPSRGSTGGAYLFYGPISVHPQQLM